MKKTIKGIGILSLVIGMLFLSNLGNEKNNKGEFTLASLLNVANAQMEWSWENPVPPDGQVEVPYTKDCPLWIDYAGEDIYYGTWPAHGRYCVWVMYPSFCTPFSPC